MWKPQGKWYYYSKSQRRGLVFFVVLLAFVQVLVLFYMLHFRKHNTIVTEVVDVEQLVLFQEEVQNKRLAYESRKDTIYPFNPNFITDYRGYILNMRVEEIDRLLSYRSLGKFISTVEEFQQVTGVSEQWIKKYRQYFKFPAKPIYARGKTKNRIPLRRMPEKIMGINEATVADLQKVYGIGPSYADRILRERTKLGGYVHINQLDYVYGIPVETLENIKKYFEVQQIPKIETLRVNHASIDELRILPYMNYYIAREIVKYRSREGEIETVDELMQIDKFPLDKIDIISLYLSFD